MPSSIVKSLSRRGLLASGATLSAAGLVLLSGAGAPAYADQATGGRKQDIDVLNGILGTEHEGIAAYQIFQDHGFVSKAMLTLVKTIQGQHREHRDFLVEKIKSIGGVPVSSKTDKEYSVDLEIDKIKDESEAFKLAMILERGAANAYIGMLPSTNDHALAKVAGRIAADEVMHWTALSDKLDKAMPVRAMTFGA